MARSLGSTPLQAFRRVALPLSWRGILAGTLLAFSRALGEFGATILIAGNIPGRTQTLALAIFQRTQIGQDDSALRLVAVTVVLAFVTVWTTEVIRGGRPRQAPRDRSDLTLPLARFTLRVSQTVGTQSRSPEARARQDVAPRVDLGLRPHGNIAIDGETSRHPPQRARPSLERAGRLRPRDALLFRT
jgi:hypothetical protein